MMIQAKTLLASLALICSGGAFGQTPAAGATQAAHFHHVHLNTTDPAAAIDFYTTKFKAEKQKFAGLMDAVWTGDSWLLFTKVNTPPPTDLVSGIWHIGWGAEDMKATFDKQVASGTKFYTPLSDITGMVGRPFFYAYVDGPDHALIELNTARHHNFGHVHLYSADPPATGEWYEKHLGLRLLSAQREERFYNNMPIAPSAVLAADHVSMIIYPVAHAQKSNPKAWQGRTDFAPTRGRVIDHLGFSVANLDETLAKLRSQGVKVTAEPRGAGPIRFAFIEGPDKVAIELIEDTSPRPPKLEE